jgi:hypothetical protein
MQLTTMQIAIGPLMAQYPTEDYRAKDLSTPLEILQNHLRLNSTYESIPPNQFLLA